MSLLFVALAAAVVAGFITWLWCGKKNAALGERLKAAATQAQKSETDLADARETLGGISREKSQLESQFAAERAKSEAKVAALTEARDRLAAEFQTVANKLFDENSRKFAEHNRTQIDALLSPLRNQLVEFRTRIDTVYKTESDDRASLKTQIEQLRQLNVRITDEAHALTIALKGQSQARGAWGELVLERLLESSGLRRGEDFLTQESLTGADGRSRVRPDIILRLPDQRHLVIDSKVSLVDYEQSINAPELTARETARKAHAASVRRHVDSLAGKKYEDTDQLFTPDYVLMFIPLEPAFITALEADGTLYEWAFDRRVILVTAPTLLATLKTVATLWKQDRQTKNVLEIAKRGGLLYDKFAGLYTDLETIGQHLTRARESYDDVLGKLKTGRGNLLAQVEELRTLGAKAQKSLPPAESAES